MTEIVLTLVIFFAPLRSNAAEVVSPGPGMSETDKAAANISPFLSDAARCGSTEQDRCSPDKMGGRTMCGMAVRNMVKCMASSSLSTSTTSECNCGGGGKDYVNCENGALDKCGYEKVKSFLDKRCSMPGAVLAYTKGGPSERGQTYGHVEFICGVGEYCSVYRKKHDMPWPRPVPDACWYPKQKSGAFESLFNK